MRKPVDKMMAQGTHRIIQTSHFPLPILKFLSSFLLYVDNHMCYLSIMEISVVANIQRYSCCSMLVSINVVYFLLTGSIVEFQLTK